MHHLATVLLVAQQTRAFVSLGRPGPPAVGAPRRRAGGGASTWHQHIATPRLAAAESSSSSSPMTTTNAEADPGAVLDSAICLVPGEVAVRVEVVPGNARRILTGVDILGADVDTVYGLLTDYEALGDVVPNLVANDVIDRTPAGARLRQVGAAQVLPGINFRASMVLDVRELPDGLPETEIAAAAAEGRPQQRDDGGETTQRLRRGVYPRPWAATPSGGGGGDVTATTAGGSSYRDVAMISVPGEPGDFTLYQGVWRAQALPECAPAGRNATRLTFSVEIQPRPWLPVALVESRIAQDLVTNMEAVATEATRRATRREAEADQRELAKKAPSVVSSSSRELRVTPHPDLVISAKDALVAKVVSSPRAGFGATRALARDVLRAANRLRQANALTGRVFSYDAVFLAGRWQVKYSSDVAAAAARRQDDASSSLPVRRRSTPTAPRSSNPLLRGRRRRRASSPDPTTSVTPPQQRSSSLRRRIAGVPVDDDDDDDSQSTTRRRWPRGRRRQADAPSTTPPTDATATNAPRSSVRRVASRAAKAAGRLTVKSMHVEIRAPNTYDTVLALNAPFATLIPPPRVRVEHLVIAPKRPFAATMVQERVRLEGGPGSSLLPRPAVPSALLQPLLGVTRLLNLDVLYADDRHLVTLSEHGDLKICERLAGGALIDVEQQQQTPPLPPRARSGGDADT